MLLDKLFGSHARAALLKMLFTDERRKAHLRELARVSGLSAPTLLREARALASDGVLDTESDGNRTLYSANASSPFYAPLKEIVSKATNGEALLAMAFADSSFRPVFIYGSRAKGTARADSDYDIFCIGNDGLRKASAILAPVRDALGVELNPYVITRDELSKRIAAGDHFLKEVMVSPKVFVKGGEDELAAMER